MGWYSIFLLLFNGAHVIPFFFLYFFELLFVFLGWFSSSFSENFDMACSVIFWVCLGMVWFFGFGLGWYDCRRWEGNVHSSFHPHPVNLLPYPLRLSFSSPIILFSISLYQWRLCNCQNGDCNFHFKNLRSLILAKTQQQSKSVVGDGVGQYALGLAALHLHRLRRHRYLGFRQPWRVPSHLLQSPLFFPLLLPPIGGGGWGEMVV